MGVWVWGCWGKWEGPGRGWGVLVWVGAGAGLWEVWLGSEAAPWGPGAGGT